MNPDKLSKATKLVLATYKGEEMPVGDQVLVVFDDCSVLYNMTLNENQERHLKIEVAVEAPIRIEGNLFTEE